MSKLLDPLAVGELELPNRVVMAPLTRNRATTPGRVPNGLMREYYRQRASAGMIITEATSVEPMGVGYPSTPGIWSQHQVEGWNAITRSVHEKGGRILLQLWHVSRISHFLLSQRRASGGTQRRRRLRQCQPAPASDRLRDAAPA